MKSKKVPARSGKKLVRILFISALVILAAAALLVRFPPRIADGAWHAESRIVMIAKGILFGALFALVGLIATEGMSGSDVLLLPAPILAGLLPVILAVFGLIWGIKVEPTRYLILDGSVYTRKDEKVCMERAGKDQAPDFAVPSSVGGFPLAYIGNGCFRGASYESVTIPGTVSGIGKRAFAGSALQRLVIEDGGTLTLMSGAFKRCKSLQTVMIRRKDVKIEKNAFRGDAVLETVTVEGDCLITGKGVFLGCPKLRSFVCRGSIDLQDEVSNPFARCPEVVLYCGRVASSVLRREARTEPFSAYEALNGGT